MLEETTIECPYCGALFEIMIDLSQGSHEMIEDCKVCCRPIQFNVHVKEDGEWHINAERA